MGSASYSYLLSGNILEIVLTMALLTQKSFSCLSVTFQKRVANFNFNFLSHFCINFQNLSAHHQEEILRIPKHTQLAKFAQNLADKTTKNKVAHTLLFKIKYQSNFGKL